MIINDELLAELEAAAKAVKGWQCGQAFQVAEEGYLPSEWYWHVGRVDEDDNQYPVLLVDTAQYDQPEQAECVARYYAAVSRDAILSLLAHIADLKAERAELKRDAANHEIEFLESWLRFAGEPIGQECCGRAYLECCGNADPVYRPPEEVTSAMAARHAELIAAMQEAAL